MQHLIPLLLTLTGLLGGCLISEPEIPGCRISDCVAIGKAQNVDSPTEDFVVIPLEIIEDSRCPIEAECIWAGRVRIKAQLRLGHEIVDLELTTEEPLRINAGLLSIAEVAPDVSSRWMPMKPGYYRLGFAFEPDAQ